MSMIEFTVVATCFNDEANIKDYLDSMSKQILQPRQYIIVDGGSKDKTVAIIEEYKRKSKIEIKCIYGERLNIAQGYNAGIRAANTEVIILTGIGNTYDSTFCDSLIRKYIESQSDIVYGVTYGQSKGKFSDAYNYLFVGRGNGTHTIPTNRGQLVRKSLFDEIGYFYERFVYAGEDVEFYNLAIGNQKTVAFTEKAKLYWETPKNLTEFNKQQRAYLIGGLQINGVNTKLLYRSLIVWLLVLFLVACVCLFYKSPITYLCLIVIYSVISVKIKNFEPLVVGLKIYTSLLYVINYFGQRKYETNDYKVKR